MKQLQIYRLKDILYLQILDSSNRKQALYFLLHSNLARGNILSILLHRVTACSSSNHMCDVYIMRCRHTFTMLYMFASDVLCWYEHAFLQLRQWLRPAVFESEALIMNNGKCL